MNPVILTGIRYGQPERDRNWKFNQERWSHLGWPIFEGVHDEPGAFCMAVASNRAAQLASENVGWDVALYVGADFAAARLEQATAACERALKTGQLVFAHTHLTLLDEDETAAVTHAGVSYAPLDLAPAGTRHPNTFSGVLALPRKLWDQVGGFDERLIGWGFDDWCLFDACNAMGRGYGRVDGDIFHLYHARSHEENEGQPHHAANHQLWGRYRKVRTSPVAMRALLSEPGGPLG